MKRTLEVIGIITLLIGSFIYNDEVLTTAKLSDDLLEEIKKTSTNYKIEPIEATIRDDTIIPGINGKEVDIKESYDKMKEIGYFNDELLIYNGIPIKNPLKENKDKYIISGNKTKKEIAIVFKVKNGISKVLKILDQENTKATFFIDSNFLEKNHNLVIKLMKEGHTIGNLSKNEEYSDSNFIWMKTIFINSGYQKNNYCFTDKRKKEIIRNCSIQNSYTIMTSINKKPFIDIKKNLTNGGIYMINTPNTNQLQSIIKYVKSKGYDIKSLESLLHE